MNPPLFIDIYQGDPVVDFNLTKNAGIVAIYHKASEGRTFRDLTYAPRRKLWMNGNKARLGSNGLMVDVAWGAYHFFHGDINIKQEAAQFVSVAEPDAKTLMVLDWEETKPGVSASAAQAKAFMQEVEAKIGRPCALYSGNVAKEKIVGHDDFFAARRLILCQYGSRWTVQKSWTKPWGWQNNGDTYGPGPHSIAGIRGYCDNNTLVTDPGQDWTTAALKFLEDWRGGALVANPAEHVPAPPAATIPTAESFTVTVTEFGGRDDRQQSAYPPYGMVDPDKLGYALPFRFDPPLPQIDVTYKGNTIRCECVDIGPVNTNDPYWRTHTAPRYKAGLDLTPAAWDALGFTRNDPIRGLVTMTWQFHPEVVAAGAANYLV